MKERILRWKPIQWFAGSRLWRYLSGHPVLSRFCNYEAVSYIICGVLSTVNVAAVSPFTLMVIGVVSEAGL